MTVKPAYPSDSPNHLIDTHKEYIVRNVYYIMDYDPRSQRISVIIRQQTP